ncbi:hypothetical protein [Methanobacterium ferruginis]|uniref:Mom family adenine methylcarbamoylation protein n=1 Tax=Methanobacterium ferruginis TaxID=710191 RepID=UPI0025745BF3|nr:hypothetical protein [Methanobacterium ferruginis]BDZ68581.1 hypothetical protein GCM10025860_20290 [Methanobacterium ferruginis]
MVDLKVDFCSYEAAKHAVLHWHYSRSMPAGKLVKIGAWENGKFIGCVLFGRGANNHIGNPYNLKQNEVCELVRIALKNHQTNVTKIVSKSLKLLKKTNPYLKLVVSYADKDQNHLGKIYQAGNWIYDGLKNQNTAGAFIIKNKKVHPRSVASMGWVQSLKWIQENVDPNARTHITKGKFKYLYPLSKKTREQIRPLKKPYPRRL